MTKFLKEAGRPLTLEFDLTTTVKREGPQSPQAAAPEIAVPDEPGPEEGEPEHGQGQGQEQQQEQGPPIWSPREVRVTFTAAGPLGLKFHDSDGRAEIARITEGTQAQRHAQLQAGQVLLSIAGESVAEKSYGEVMELVRQSSARPLTMTFAIGAVPDVSTSKPKQDALSEQNDEEEEEQQQEELGPGVHQYTFTEPRPLGLTFEPSPTQPTQILLASLKEGSQAAERQVPVGMRLLKVDSWALTEATAVDEIVGRLGARPVTYAHNHPILDSA
eukprot:COSAG04_NODE_5409_length_1629_cov_1.125490_1_plen_274_part_00